MTLSPIAPSCGLALLASLTALPGLAAQEGPDHPRQRWEWFYRQRAYPFADVPAGALDRARTQAASLRAAPRLAPPPISGTQWQPLGPTAIPIAGTSIGRITAIAIHPTQTSTIYIGGAQGGVWKTTDAGITWTPRTDQQCSLAMGSIALDPVNPEIVYAATGEQHFSGDSYYGCGILRSTDGGATWTRFGATTFVRSRIARIVVAPSTAGTPASTRLLAASDNGLWRSVDGGATWVSSRSGIATDVVLDPTNDQVAYAAIRGQGVFRSADGGLTWGLLGSGFPTGNVGRVNLAIAPTAPGTLLAAVENIGAGTLLGVWKTTDGAVSWAQLAATGASCQSQCWYDMLIAFDPSNENTVYFGGVLLYRSVDGGASFTGITGSIHVDQHTIAFDPGNPMRVYVGNDGGIYRSDNGGTSWASLNDGLALTQFYSGISLHPSDRTIVLGGTQDNGTLRYTGVPTWAFILGGDGGFTAIDPDNPIIQYAETQWIASSGYSGPRRSDGAGFNLKIAGINLAEAADFIPPLVMDPSDGRVLYFGTKQLYRTADRAESWTAISPSLGGLLTAIAPAPSEPATIYLGSSTGGVHVSRDLGVSWSPRPGLPVRSVTDIAVDRLDPLTAYVTFSGFGTGHIYRTVNAGQSWSNVSGGLPNAPINAVVLDPVNRGFVMVGTDVGVFVSGDSGITWTALAAGMPNVAVFDLAYNPATGALVAATHGRGMFRLDLDRALTLAVVPSRRRWTVTEGAIPARPDSSTVVLSGTGAAAAAWTAVTSAHGRLALTTPAGVGSGRVRWNRTLAGARPGTYVDTVTVTAAGAIDSPSRVIDTAVVEPAIPTLSVDPLVRRDTVVAGATAPRPDSATVSLPGQAGATMPWTATAAAPWINLTAGSGVGSGKARWNRNPTGLSIGNHVETIRIVAAGAIGSPGNVVDSLTVLPALALAPGSARATAVSGGPDSITTTAQLTIGGDPGGTQPWTVTRGAGTWNVLTTAAGQGAAAIGWRRSGLSLRDGIYVDTITVTAGVVKVRLVDTLVVTAPALVNRCAADHLLGAPCLDPIQLRWLDLAGNRDGQFNLGDLVALFARAALPPPPTPALGRRRPEDRP